MGIIRIPAPWGLGVMLGLVKDVVQPIPVTAGDYLVEQTASQGNMYGACERLVRLAMDREQAPPPSAAPWAAAFYRGPIGTIKVTGCRISRDYKKACRIFISDPRSDWSGLEQGRAA